MNIQRQRVVAFIACHLLGPVRADSIIDLQVNHETKLTGEISPALISVFDHDRNDYVLGHKKACKTIVLTDLATQYGVELLVNDGDFQGVDHETGKSFKGVFADRVITFYDDADQSTYQYRI